MKTRATGAALEAMFQFMINTERLVLFVECAREDTVVVVIIVVVGVDVSVGVIVVARARTRITHLQSERPARRFRGHRWSYENTSDRCSTLSHVSGYDEKPNPSDWSHLLPCVREDIVVVIIIIVVGVNVSVGVVVVVRARTRIAQLQSERPVCFFS
jgi:magnesium-transporting ATPase (P-type)